MFDCVLLMAGSSQRMNTNVNKVRLLLKGKPVYEYSLDLFLKIEELNRIVLVVNSNDYDELKIFGRVLN